MSNVITTLANWVGRNLFYLFKFFANLSGGLIAVFAVLMIVFFLIFQFRFANKVMVDGIKG